MSSFYIKELSIGGNKVQTSSIEFRKGLNIICGPSDTGKSYIAECINFMFGCDVKDFRINKDRGYDYVSMEIATEDGNIFLKRNFGENHIHVKSDNNNIESGKYSKNKSKLCIGNLYLKLMGINNPPTIIKNQHFERQSLTLRTFLHTFFIEEDNVFQKESILFKRKEYANTAILSSLLYFMTGDSFEDFDPKEEKKIRETRKNAIMSYINDNLSSLYSREKQLTKDTNFDIEIIQEKIDSILNEITEKESQITIATIKSKELSNEIYNLNDQLAECNMLSSRYQFLRSQYISDIKRLTFIVEGEVNGDDFSQVPTCPICSGALPKLEEPSFIEASKIELEKIILKIGDLEDAESDLGNELENLQNRSTELNRKRREIESLINSKLKPQIVKLRQTLDEYRLSIEINKESSVIKDFRSSMISDLEELEVESVSDIKYKPKEYFNEEFLNIINKKLDKILRSSCFENFNSVSFDLATFDLVVNGNPKLSYGKGYRAFLNTALALAFREYLSEHGKFSPGLLIIDSPILSLKEKGSEKASDSMKVALFKYLVGYQDIGQTIIIENDIPRLDYGRVNVVKFTKDRNVGRYGFLNGVE